MAKEIGDFEVIIRGNKSEGPKEVFVKYFVQDSINTELRSSSKEKVFDAPSIAGMLAKKLHDQGIAGESWTDAISVLESKEEI